MIRTKDITKILETKLHLDSSLIDKLSENDKLKEARVETRIKEIIGSTLSIRERNAFSKCLTKTFMNQVNNKIPEDDFVSLSDYVKGHTDYHIRPSDIKKLLNKLDYLVGDYPTGKAYRLDYVFTQFITYQIRGCKRSKEILKLWRKKFLDNVIKRNQDELESFRSIYSFTRPRTLNEGLNCINNTLTVLFMENPELSINLYERYSMIRVHLTNLEGEMTNARAVNQIRYVCKHMRHIQKTYGNDYIKVKS